jgi:sulfur-carrier protein adenylyltransferase/sulfurtransferase
VDFDRVDVSNLHRQVMYGDSDLGLSKAQRAAQKMRDINPHIEVEVFDEALAPENAVSIVERFDMVADGTDNFPTRYLVNDTCVRLGKTNVHGAIFRFEGQVSVFDALRGPCYRCIFPEPPAPGTVPNCAEAGVLGVLPGIIGCLQASEVVKLVLGIGEPLVGRLLMFDALTNETRIMRLPKDPDCPACAAGADLDALDLGASVCAVNLADRELDSETEVSATDLSIELAGPNPPLLLDVREAIERRICVLPDQFHIPNPNLEERLAELGRPENLVVYCHAGLRSAYAAALLRAKGFPRVRNLVGGIDAWSEEVDPSVPRY